MSEPTLLKKLVRERCWTYDQFRRAYEQAAKDIAARSGERISTASVEEQTFRRWTSGKVVGLPNRPAPQVLEHLFGCPVSLLLRPPTGAQASAASRHVPALDESDLAMTARDAAAHAGEAAALSLFDMTLDQLEDDVTALARAYSATSPAEVYRRARELLVLSQTLLDRTQVPRQRTRAYLAAGQASALLSAVCFDLGSLATAVQMSRTAALYGQVVEHGPLQAYAHGALAFLAYWGGRPAAAVRFVHAAQGFAGLGDTAMIRLAVIEGRAYGHLGKPTEAVHAVRRALDQSTGVRDELHDDVGGEFGFPADRVAMSNATTYLLLRNAGGADEAARSALQLLSAQPADQRSLMTATQASVDLARARLLRHDLDGACEALEPVFAVPPERRGSGVLERLAAARTELGRQTFSEAKSAGELGERMEDFIASASAQKFNGAVPLAVEG